MSTDAPVRAVTPGADRPPPRGPVPDRILGVVAALAGVVAVVAALCLPFAPVLMSTPEVSWPDDPARPSPTMLLLTAYEPATFEARFSCRALRDAEESPDGLVLATMTPGTPELADRGLVVTAAPGELVVRSSGDVLLAGPVPPGDCTIAVRGDATAMTVAVDGRIVSTTPSRTPEPDDDVLPDSGPETRAHTPLPEVDVLTTGIRELPGAGPDDLSVRMVLDDAFDTTPAPAKSALLLTTGVALAIGAPAAVGVAARARRRDHLPRGRWRSWRVRRRRRVPLPRPCDLAVLAVLAAWTVLAPMTDDDGYYSAMAANVTHNGYVANYYQLYNQGFTPFSWIYHALSWWQGAVGVAPVLLRLPSTVLGVVTWVLIRAFVARAGLFAPGARGGPIALRTVLTAAFLAWWLPYDAGVRPEPVIAALLVATLVAVAEGLEARRIDVLGLAVGLAALGATVAPTGFATLGPLMAAAPAVWRLVREQTRSWSEVAVCWVILLAPGSVGLVTGFADGSWRDFVRSQEIFAPIQRAQTWYDELDRYAQLLDTTSHFGAYARRLAVLVCLLALVGFLLTAVAARVRDLPVPARVMQAGWATALAFALLLPTPSNPTHHFGALAGIGVPFLALMLVVGPGLVRALADGRRTPTAALVAACVTTALVLALTWHGRHLWPYAWGLGMPSYGERPTLAGLDLDQPLLWLAGLVAATGAVALATRWRGRRWRRVAPAVAIPVVVTTSLLLGTGWTLAATAGAAVRTADTWSPQADAWVDPLARRCGAAQRIDVLDPAGTRALVPGPPAPAAPPGGPGPAAFLPGAWLASDPPPPLPPATAVRGSFLVPSPGANADARTGTTIGAWSALPPATHAAQTAGRGPDEALVVAVSGRIGGGTSLRAEYAAAEPDASGGSRPVGSAQLGPREGAAWGWVPLLEETAPPPEADLVRLVGVDESRQTGGWLAFSDPVVRPWTPMSRLLPPGAPTAVEWTQSFLFPCARQPVQRHGVTEPVALVVGDGPDPRAGLVGWTFDPDRGGLLGNAVRAARVTPLAVRFAGGPGDRDEVTTVQVYELRHPYPLDRYELRPQRREVSGLG